MFADDHGDYLPNAEDGIAANRGLSVAQKAGYSTSDTSPHDWLVYYIQPYVGAPPPQTTPTFPPTTNIVKVLYCPSNEHYNISKNPDFFSYEMVEGSSQAGSVSRYCGLPWNPFGYNNGSGSGGTVPHKLAELPPLGSIADIWAIVDSDQQGNSGAGPAVNFPPVPAHGTTRNYLWFDWHVAPIKAPPAGTGDSVHTRPFYRWKE
jgi:prepilin-type processing-associated H-X9-DG protein